MSSETPQSNPRLEKYREESSLILQKRGKMVLDSFAKSKKSEKEAEVSDNEDGFSMPKKGDHRMRAHCNPLCDTPFPLYAN